MVTNKKKGTDNKKILEWSLLVSKLLFGVGVIVFIQLAPGLKKSVYRFFVIGGLFAVIVAIRRRDSLREAKWRHWAFFLGGIVLYIIGEAAKSLIDEYPPANAFGSTFCDYFLILTFSASLVCILFSFAVQVIKFFKST